MYTFLLVGIFFIVLVFLLFLAWRFGSRRYSLPCPVWMKWMLDPPFTGELSVRTRKTIQYLDLNPGMNILDAGCGPGRFTIPAAKRVGPDGTVTALDIQEGMLRETGERAARDNLTNIRLIQAGIGNGKTESNSYDRAVLITVLGEIPDREGALREMYSALKPGGILLIEETIRDPHFQTRTTVRALTRNQGFHEKAFFGNRFSYTMLLEKPFE